MVQDNFPIPSVRNEERGKNQTEPSRMTLSPVAACEASRAHDGKKRVPESLGGLLVWLC